MKKLSVLLLICILVLGCFAFGGCQDQVQIDIESSIVGLPDITEMVIPGETLADNKHYWIVKYFVNPAECDLSTVNSIKIKTYMPTKKNGDLKTYLKTFDAIIPEDVAPTAENNYFYLKLEKKKYDPTAERPYDYTTGQYGDNFYLDAKGVKHFYFYRDFDTVTNCYIYINDNGEIQDNPIAGVTKIPSIGMTFAIGVVMVLIGFGLYLLAMLVFQNKLAIAIAFCIPLFLTIGTWIVWGVWRGIIMTVFFIIYYICIESFSKRVAENLGY